MFVIYCIHNARLYTIETQFVSDMELSIPCIKVINNNNNNKFFWHIGEGPLTDQNHFPRDREKLWEGYLPCSSGTVIIKSPISIRICNLFATFREERRMSGYAVYYFPRAEQNATLPDKVDWGCLKTGCCETIWIKEGWNKWDRKTLVARIS